MPPLFTPCPAGYTFTDLLSTPVNLVSDFINASGSYGAPVDFSASVPTDVVMSVLRVTMDTKLTNITAFQMQVDDNLGHNLLFMYAEGGVNQFDFAGGPFIGQTPQWFTFIFNTTLNWAVQVQGMEGDGNSFTYSIDLTGYWA